ESPRCAYEAAAPRELYAGVCTALREKGERCVAPGIRDHVIWSDRPDGRAQQDRYARLREAVDLGHEDFHRNRVAALREIEGGSHGDVHLDLSVPALDATRPIGGGPRGRQD